MLVFREVVRSAKPQTHGSDPSRIKQKSLRLDRIQGLGWRGDGNAASRQVASQVCQGSMHECLEQFGLILSGGRGQIPEVGIEGLIAGGSDEADQSLLLLIQDAEMPEAALQREGPALHWMRLVTARLQQGVDAGAIGNMLHAEAVALRQAWNGSLLAKRKQSHLAGVAHAGGNAVDGQQSAA